MTSTTNAATEAASTEQLTMRAAKWSRYGAPADVIDVAEVPRPAIGDDEVLVRVHAAGANPYDWHFYRGDPYLIRPTVGFRKPRKTNGLGADFAGEVVAVGDKVSGYRRGDRVFGEVSLGAFAEYAAAKPESMAHIPAVLSYEQAAAIPMGALTAVSSLRDVGKLAEGQSVMINGASGGIGHMAVQLAKAMGASRVVAVCSGRNAEMVKALGADEVIDYTQEDYTEIAEKVDLFVETQYSQPFTKSVRALKPRGTFASAGGGGGKLLGPGGPMLRALIAGLFRTQRVRAVFASTSGKDLEWFASLAAAGRLRAVVDAVYPLDDVAKAMQHLETGHVRGKVVITP